MDALQLNAVTIGAWGINFFTIAEGLGLWAQVRTIWRKRSGASVSVGSNLFLTGLCLASIIYGQSAQRPPITINGLVLAIGLAITCVGLWRFKGYQRWEKYFAAFLATLLCLMLVTGHHAQWYFVFQLGGIISLVLQPWEIWHNKSAGAVDVRTNLIFLSGTLFWVIYGYAVKDWVLMTVCPGYLLIQISIVVLWWIYRPR